MITAELGVDGLFTPYYLDENFGSILSIIKVKYEIYFPVQLIRNQKHFDLNTW